MTDIAFSSATMLARRIARREVSGLVEIEVLLRVPSGQYDDDNWLN